MAVRIRLYAPIYINIVMSSEDSKLVDAYRRVYICEQSQNAEPYNGPYDLVIWLSDLDSQVEKLRQAVQEGTNFRTAHCALKQDLEEMGIPTGNAEVYIFSQPTDFTQAALIPVA